MGVWSRRLALLLVFVLALSVGMPYGGPPVDGSFPLDGLKRLLSLRVAWAAQPVDPETPDQNRGSPADWGHRATTAQTRGMVARAVRAGEVRAGFRRTSRWCCRLRSRTGPPRGGSSTRRPRGGMPRARPSR